MERKTREVGGNANFPPLNFYVLLALSSQLSVFLKLCIINTFVHFLLRQSCCSFRNMSMGFYPFLGYGLFGLYHGWL